MTNYSYLYCLYYLSLSLPLPSPLFPPVWLSVCLSFSFSLSFCLSSLPSSLNGCTISSRRCGARFGVGGLRDGGEAVRLVDRQPGALRGEALVAGT